MKRWGILILTLAFLLGAGSMAWAGAGHHHAHEHNPFDQVEQLDKPNCPLHKKHLALGKCPHSEGSKLPVAGLFADCGKGSKSGQDSGTSQAPAPVAKLTESTSLATRFSKAWIPDSPLFLTQVELATPPPKIA